MPDDEQQAGLPDSFILVGYELFASTRMCDAASYAARWECEDGHVLILRFGREGPVQSLLRAGSGGSSGVVMSISANGAMARVCGECHLQSLQPADLESHIVPEGFGGFQLGRDVV